MDEILLIDGYNIIHAWDRIFDVDNEPLEDLRDRLINIMSNYQGYRKINVVIVFDAQGANRSKTTEEKIDGITVVYTGEKESADHYIERYVYNMSDRFVVRVATSDYLQQQIILNNGGVRMSARELMHEVFQNAKKVDKFNDLGKPRKRNTIMSSIPDDVLKDLKRIVKNDKD
ncbi:MAG: NYN domain-containing protein [Clostridiaceae bacterium]|jgi:predicted RNA-binding protein with PIN domain|nr:NYN domain-containing protein [Clostridiaceae bacterium]